MFCDEMDNEMLNGSQDIASAASDKDDEVLLIDVEAETEPMEDGDDDILLIPLERVGGMGQFEAMRDLGWDPEEEIDDG